MNIQSPWFYQLNQTLTSNCNLKFIDIDLSWLHDWAKNKDAYSLINISTSLEDVKIPQGRSLYIFAWFFEVFNDHWFLEQYYNNPQAEFVILCDMFPNDLVQLHRVKIFNVCHHSTWIKAIKQMNPGPVTKPLSDRKFKISSLSSRLSEYKFFITSKLLAADPREVVLRWNLGFEIRDHDSYIFDNTGYLNIDELLVNKQKLKVTPINQEQFINNPLNNSLFAHAAYQDTIINSINETQNLSKTPEFGILPTPYISEKTWKPLFAGNAVLFAGQTQTKQRLEKFGFQFDYPWAGIYDKESNDNHRLSIILNNIDWILSLSHQDLTDLCYESVMHNVELAWSIQVENLIGENNNQSIGSLKQYLGA